MPHAVEILHSPVYSSHLLHTLSTILYTVPRSAHGQLYEAASHRFSHLNTTVINKVRHVSTTKKRRNRALLNSMEPAEMGFPPPRFPILRAGLFLISGEKHEVKLRRYPSGTK